MPFCIGWVENFDEIALSRTVKEISNLCFSIFVKKSKIQNGRHMWEEENFLKIAKSAVLRHPVSRKFRRNYYYYYYYVFILSAISPYTTGLKALFNQSDCTGTAPTHK